MRGGGGGWGIFAPPILVDLVCSLAVAMARLDAVARVGAELLLGEGQLDWGGCAHLRAGAGRGERGWGGAKYFYLEEVFQQGIARYLHSTLSRGGGGGGGGAKKW